MKDLQTIRKALAKDIQTIRKALGESTLSKDDLNMVIDVLSDIGDRDFEDKISRLEDETDLSNTQIDNIERIAKREIRSALDKVYKQIKKI